ncbi:hypothetical protein H6P81_003199 [Aristolochia fimbriata]|uniref:Uncharacterized protein n=1 Tax=Aristolochia fimbriata TaxID=158543 RepID=A0AAV7FD04_ARIFI|nr:hypothetical protein H6P81_003199 [Aristolochia fimbriata]
MKRGRKSPKCIRKVSTKSIGEIEGNPKWFESSKRHPTVDTGATHKFMVEEDAKRLRLRWTKDGCTMKVVNSVAKAVCGVSKDVKVKVGKWEGTVNFTIVAMNEFNFILGIDFLSHCEAFVLPYLGMVGILDENGPCTLIEAEHQNVMGKTQVITSLQLKRSLNHGDFIYIAALVAEPEGSTLVPKEMILLLDEKCLNDTVFKPQLELKIIF